MAKLKSIYAWSIWLVAVILGVLLGARLGLLIGFLLAAVFTDITDRKIPNRLIGAGILSGFLVQTIPLTGDGFVFAVSGLGLGFVLFFPLFLLRVMAAGDVKLMAMVGCFVGAQSIIGVVLCTLLAGGVLALLFSLKLKSTQQLLFNAKIMTTLGVSRILGGKAPVGDDTVESIGTLPYAMAIAIGTAGYLVWQGI